MIPQPGQRVKCFLNNSTVVEGTVEHWDDKGVVLKSVDAESLLIIHHPTEDIRLTKVLLPKTPTAAVMTEKPMSSDLQQEFRQTTSAENDVDLRTQSLAQLHQLKAQQERKIIISKLRDHHLGQIQQVKYEQPGFGKMPGTK